MQYGPGAENAFAGVATAFSDSSPVVFLPLGHPRETAQLFPMFKSSRTYASITKSVEEVILPEATLKLLDRNVLSFVQDRPRLRELGQSTRKGILLYGPPGTGKTHTIRYLASHLPGHTTLIITAGQIGLLGQYMNLARLLQPAMVVIEDADLIARDREQMGSCDEVLLNKLLNEMDGLKQDADILFVLTTNRPEQLESALAGRPGRID